MAAPGTRPPPSTRSTSPMPTGRRTTSPAPASPTVTTRARRALSRADRRSEGTSTRAPSALHWGQKPIHLALSCPHTSHRYFTDPRLSTRYDEKRDDGTDDHDACCQGSCGPGVDHVSTVRIPVGIRGGTTGKPWHNTQRYGRRLDRRLRR